MQVTAQHNENENVKIREYINSAVYVETAYDMTACKQNSMYVHLPGGGDHPKILKVKRCVCFTNPHECGIHPKPIDEGFPSPYHRSNSSSTLPDNKLTPTKSYSNFDSDSGITVKHNVYSPNDLRLSIPSLTTTTLSTVLDDPTKEENFRNWCARKNQEKKLNEEKEQLLNEIKRKKREQQLENERENFKKWLANKKRDEEMRKREIERQIEEERDRQGQKEKRLLESEMNFQMWLKRKEVSILEKKIKQEVAILKREEDRQRRLQYSTKAYEIWLEQSKSKPKPLPLNRGLESLRSSVSVTYINPQPWVPNIDANEKPASQ